MRFWSKSYGWDISHTNKNVGCTLNVINSALANKTITKMLHKDALRKFSNLLSAYYAVLLACFKIFDLNIR